MSTFSNAPDGDRVIVYRGQPKELPSARVASDGEIIQHTVPEMVVTTGKGGFDQGWAQFAERMLGYADYKWGGFSSWVEEVYIVDKEDRFTVGFRLHSGPCQLFFTKLYSRGNPIGQSKAVNIENQKITMSLTFKMQNGKPQILKSISLGKRGIIRNHTYQGVDAAAGWVTATIARYLAEKDQDRVMAALDTYRRVVDGYMGTQVWRDNHILPMLTRNTWDNEYRFDYNRFHDWKRTWGKMDWFQVLEEVFYGVFGRNTSRQWRKTIGLLPGSIVEGDAHEFRQFLSRFKACEDAGINPDILHDLARQYIKDRKDAVMLYQLNTFLNHMVPAMDYVTLKNYIKHGFPKPLNMEENGQGVAIHRFVADTISNLVRYQDMTGERFPWNNRNPNVNDWEALHQNVINEVNQRVEADRAARRGLEMQAYNAPFDLAIAAPDLAHGPMHYKGITLMLPNNGEMISKWGNMMNNCIGGYVTDHRAGDVTLFGAYRDGELIANGEIRNKQVHQLLGKYNKALPKKDFDTILVILDEFGVTVSPTCWGAPNRNNNPW